MSEHPTVPDGRSASSANLGVGDPAVDRLTPGTSALFLLTSDAVVDRVRAAFGDERPELIFTNLSPEQEEKLREIFAETESPMSTSD